MAYTAQIQGNNNNFEIYYAHTYVEMLILERMQSKLYDIYQKQCILYLTDSAQTASTPDDVWMKEWTHNARRIG